MRAPALVAALAALAVHAAACGQTSTPERTFDATRAIASGLDPVATFRLHDDYARTSSLQLVRDVRACIARGDDPAEVCRGLAISEEDARSAATDEELAARMLAKFSPLARASKWLESAMPAGPTERVEPDVARMRLRGTDGREADLWLVLEQGRWVVNPRCGITEISGGR